METKLGPIRETPDYRAMLKAILKRQIQHLVDQLSTETDEECVFLTASITDGTLSHLGSDTGKSFLETNKDFKSQFLGFCLTEKYLKESNRNRTSSENYPSVYPGGNTPSPKRMKPSLVSQRHPLLPHKSPRKNPYPTYKPASVITDNVNVEKISTDIDAIDTNNKQSPDMVVDQEYHNSTYQGHDIVISNELNINKQKSNVRKMLMQSSANKELGDNSHRKSGNGPGECGTSSSRDAFTNAGGVRSDPMIKIEQIDFVDEASTPCSTVVNLAKNLNLDHNEHFVKTKAGLSLQNISSSKHQYNVQASPKESLMNVYSNIFQSINQDRGTRSSRIGTGSKSSAGMVQDDLICSDSDLRDAIRRSLSYKEDSSDLAISQRDLSNQNQNESTIKKKRKRNDLTLADRYKVLKLLDKKLTQTEISKIIGCSISQVCRINGHKDKILAQYFSNTNPDRKRQRTGKASDIDVALKTFYEEARDKGVPPTASVLTEMAKELAQELKVPDFTPSGSWISRWKLRCNIGEKLPRVEKKLIPE